MICGVVRYILAASCLNRSTNVWFLFLWLSFCIFFLLAEKIQKQFLYICWELWTSGFLCGFLRCLPWYICSFVLMKIFMHLHWLGSKESKWTCFLFSEGTIAVLGFYDSLAGSLHRLLFFSGSGLKCELLKMKVSVELKVLDGVRMNCQCVLV